MLTDEMVGPYRILGKLGEGGMGEVYRARDTKLDRDVALKILPDAFTDDPERLARFQREAKVLASLNHPNIAAIYGLEDSGETHALVLELVEGPTLADRISQGAIPLDEALPIAKQIAEALEAAHEQGIIHRDLKPANIKVTGDGMVKVLDFGLAKAIEDVRSAGSSDPASEDVANSPTMSMTAAATRAGFILGTAAYMSPEQARGKPVDKRTDIWAFGVVLYEMLTGRQAFEAEDLSLTLAEVMKSDPDLALLPHGTPPRVETLIGRCLVKDPKERVRDIGDVRLALGGAFESAGPPALAALQAAEPPPIWHRRRFIMSAMLFTLAAGSVVGWIAGRDTGAPAPRPVVRVPIALPPGDGFTLLGPGTPNGIALSRDGARLAYAAIRDGTRQIFVRDRNQLDPVPLPGTRGGTFPFFSPDGDWVGFFTGTALMKVSLAGGSPVTLCAATGGAGASWGPDDTIVFASDDHWGLMTVSARGGEPQPLTTPTDGQRHGWPVFLPDGGTVAYTVGDSGAPIEQTWQIKLVDVATSAVRPLVNGMSPKVSSAGYLLFARTTSLWAAPFDLATLTLTGEAVPVIDGVDVDNSGAAYYAIADDGTLAYRRSMGNEVPRAIRWMTSDGTTEAIPLSPDFYRHVELSPDGGRLAVDLAGESDIWTLDLLGGARTRVTFGQENNWYMAWTPDGERLVFSSGRDGGGVYMKAADGTGQAEMLAQRGAFPNGAFVSHVVPDGRSVLFFQQFAGSSWDIFSLSLDDDHVVEPLLDAAYGERRPRVSPDGRWIAYMSDESGQNEIYVRPFPNVDDGKWSVSTGGGWTPKWGPDGQTLYYRTDDRLMAADVRTDPTFAVIGRRVVLQSNGDWQFPVVNQSDFAVSPDGDRFVVVTEEPVEQSSTSQDRINIVLNWEEELKARVPTP